MRRSSRLLTLVLITAAAVPRAAAAQEFRGELRSDADDAPLGSALITLLDDTGRVLRAALTDASGRFRVAAPGAGVYRLQAELIGYRTTTTLPLDVARGDTISVPLRVPVQPITLAALDITGANVCRVRPQEGLAAHALWEQASKALRAAAVLQELELIEYTVTTYEREVSLPRGRQHTERQPSRRVSGRPFATLSVDQLADQGYVHKHENEVLYHGPDAHVLLSEPFLDTHCMRAERRGAERRGLIGMAFEPVPGRSVPDIAGVLWLDERTGELQHVTYRYTGLEGRRIAEASGRIEFDRLDNGVWVVRRWWIRMHRVTRDLSPRGTGDLVPLGYLEMGGEVTEVVKREAPAAG